MSEWHSFAPGIQLFVSGRIEQADADRQERTAREILKRLADQPGLILADEVGMGKTFVALAVAASVALSDEQRRPVVVMVPPSLKTKWPQDFAVFSDRCLVPESRPKVRAASAETAVDFLKFLDDPEDHKRSIIFLTHGAMSRGLTDGWVKLAMVQRALHRRRDTAALKRSICRCAGPLFWLGWVDRQADGIFERLLDADPSEWLKILHRYGIDPEGDDDPSTDDDPVPQAVIEALYNFDTTEVYLALQQIPQRQSGSYDERVAAARNALTQEIKKIWHTCLTRLNLKLPLLVMDEAHHLKNPEAKLSGLFNNPDAKDDAEAITRGPLGGMFERMLFLTATPFQLGHHELCSVIKRFEGIAWDSKTAPPSGREAFCQRLEQLQKRLDAAQQSALILDESWGRIRPEDLAIDGRTYAIEDIEFWWKDLQVAQTRPPMGEELISRFQKTDVCMRAAEAALQPWVLRHLRERTFKGNPRRERLVGRAILTDNVLDDEGGMEVSGDVLLPFLLAARATACAPESRPVFAEGLASSYQAFLETRRSQRCATDTDDDVGMLEESGSDHIGEWYLNRLELALPQEDQGQNAHPKIAATAKRALAAWSQGEKVVVFCHYVRTGQVLRQAISSVIADSINRQGAAKLGCTPEAAAEELERLGTRFFDVDSPVRKAADDEVRNILASFQKLNANSDLLVEVTRRYLRTPSFLARFFPLSGDRLDQAGVQAAFAAGDGSGLTLRDMLVRFFDFLENRCVEEERQRYLGAIQNIQTGTITGHDVRRTFAEDECQGTQPERLLPNVRLVNGSVKQDTRQRLMLTFNSPFFPEILIASSVMAEGVDLHRFCRFVIHHDLCWNPSTLEQRTGRVDRIGAKVERCGKPIRVYLPYLAETQDEKQYRVVMDRERWFNVVMGEQFKVDARTTEKIARRIPLPAALAQSLAFRLEALSPEGRSGTNAAIPSPRLEPSAAQTAEREPQSTPQQKNQPTVGI